MFIIVVWHPFLGDQCSISWSAQLFHYHMVSNNVHELARKRLIFFKQ